MYAIDRGDSLIYSYKGRSTDIDSYQCPKIFDSLEQAEFDAKVTAIYWSLEAILEPAIVIDCQTQTILAQNHAFSLLVTQIANKVEGKLIFLPKPVLIVTFIVSDP